MQLTSTQAESSLDPQHNTAITYPTPHDVDQVRNILLTHVHYELADLILSEAQYWARFSTKRDTLLEVLASAEPRNAAQWVYMISDPIPTVYSGERIVPTRVKSVRFLLESCDQGWGGPPENTNTFLSAYSWFEASILRPPSDDSRPTLPKWIKKAINRPVNISAFTDDDFGFTEVRSPYKSKNERWLVQKNLQASRDVRYYEVAWPDPSSGVRDAEPKPEHNEMSGSGRGLEFVETLQAGDRIALVARALYPGWANHVHSAEIEVAYQT